MLQDADSNSSCRKGAYSNSVMSWTGMQLIFSNRLLGDQRELRLDAAANLTNAHRCTVAYQAALPVCV